MLVLLEKYGNYKVAILSRFSVDMTARRVQWLRGRASHSLLREPGFEYCAAVSNLGLIFSLYIAPVHSAV